MSERLNSLFDLTGRVALVTGGAGDIGIAYARGLAEAGASVALADLNADAAQAAAGSLTDAGHTAIGMGVDVTSPESAAAMVATTMDSYGRVDILINNAAIMRQLPPYGLTTMPLADFDMVMNVNFRGPLVCSQAVFPVMRKQRYGRIIHGLSAGAFIPGGIYGVSKFALHGLTINMASEFAHFGINVNAIAPGLVASESGYEALPKDSEFRTAIEATIPGKKSAPPEDLVGTLLLLCSPAGDWINGQSILVDGGWVTRL